MADKRLKKVKFALFLKNNEEVRTKDDFKKYFDMTGIIEYLFDGKLLQWMRNHDYPNSTCRAVEELLKNYNRKTMLFKNLTPENEKIFTREFIRELCKIFEINETETEEIESIEQIIKSADKEDAILEIAAFEDDDEEEEILQYVNQIVRTQTELNEVINRLKAQKKAGKYKIVYLINKDEPYKLNKEDVFDSALRFVGINRQGIEDETKISIEQRLPDGTFEVMEKEQLKILCSKPENRDRFSNLKIITRKRTSIDSYDADKIDCQKIKMSYEGAGKYDTGATC